MAAADKRRESVDVSNEFADSLDKYMDRKEAATYLGYSDHYLHRKACEMTGPPYKRLGRKAWYLKTDLDAFAESEKKRKGLENAGPVINSHKVAKPAAEAFADAFSSSGLSSRRDMQPGVINVDSLNGFETWPDGVYIHPHGIFIKRSKWR